MTAVVDFINQLEGLEQKQADDLLHDFVITELLAVKLENLPTQDDRVKQVEQLTDSYFSQYGEHVNASTLEKLSDYLLLDYLKSQGKPAATENQFHSPVQNYRRKMREISVESAVMDYVSARDGFCIPVRRRTQELEADYN